MIEITQGRAIVLAVGVLAIIALAFTSEISSIVLPVNVDKDIVAELRPKRCMPDTCRQKLRLSSVPLQRVALQSLPGSGNTWTRHMLQQATRRYSTSVYCDRKLERSGFPAECLAVTNSTRFYSYGIVTKTHYPAMKVGHGRTRKDLKPKGTILLVRSPFDFILSDFQRKYNRGDHTKTLPESVFRGPKWRKWVLQKIEKWIKGAQKQAIANIIGSEHMLVVYYEALRRDPRSELTRMLEFLYNTMEMGKELPPIEEGVDCALLNLEGSNHRKRKKKFENPYKGHPDLVEMICKESSSFWNEDLWGHCDGTLQAEREAAGLVKLADKTPTLKGC